MNVNPCRTFVHFLYFIFTAFLVNLSCNKDEDALLDAVLSEENTIINNQDIKDLNNQVSEVADFKEEPEDVKILKSLVSRITIFKPVQDAYVQNGKGFNQHIIRLDENRRTGYLMFDLSQIDSIGGEITSATLKFVINQDSGNGKIKVYKGESQNWSEDSLSETSAPSKGVQLGEIQQDYDLNTTIGIDLNHREILPTYSTLILGHFEGNDIAFASKENNRIQASQLEITYNAPMNSDVIEDEQGIPESEQPTEETEEVDTTTEEPVEETTEEETVEEQPMDEETEEVDTTTEEPVEETTEEETVEEQPMDEETGEVDTTTEEPVEETTEEETVEEKPMDEETGEVDTTTEEPVEEPTTEEPDQEPVLPIKPSNSPPMAKADASPLSGFAPLDVTFSSANSTDDKAITTFQWSFQDGNTVSRADVDHTFTEPGTYKVVLKVSDEEGLTATDEVTITVKEVTNEAPVATATANISSGPAPLEVNFTGSNSTDDNSVNTYKWDFGDGSTSSKADPTHNFSEPGSYKVQLKVSDEAGLTDTDELTITIEEISNEAPIAKASANSTSGTAPLTIDFKGSNSTDDTAVSTYYWNFQDGSTSTDPDPSHTFDSSGTYEVTLSVEDEGELSDIDTITIIVDAPVNEAPNAVVSADIVSGESPLEVAFTGGGSTDD
uniref:PKD domain-containing protein n=1 Tax=Pareuzebyella sediminis TaxID=2607998 RepID=UPI0011EBC447